MLLSSVGALFLSITFAVAQQPQQTVANGNGMTPVATQYADQFKNVGGKVLSDQVNVYAIFYGDWKSSPADQNTVLTFVDRVSSTPWYNTCKYHCGSFRQAGLLFFLGAVKEYTGNDGKTVGSLHLAAALTDSGSHGLNLTDNNTHKQIVIDAVNSGYLSADNQLDGSGIYVIFAAKDVKDAGFCTSHCGYNSYSDQFQYMYIGYPGQCPQSCIPSINNATSPNNNPAVDTIITIFSHELQDILTDPRDNSWIIKAGQSTFELGDFCSGKGVTQEQWFGNVSQQDKAGYYNLAIDNNKYLVQTIYSREKKACVLSKN
ncbi:hypothetical protein DFQ28_004986 [Apophysomyces sp. BC1034]|nr:hypothetical protein DFQ30_004942 [Apophysomyces sp. BC1015]KAG0178061.1 hypothetical protein DFQ29_004002 [Apophysomyces sp. BC1021]KAG0188321.1 hypothetical protein DFQ28_004986 [Apophysomyces sp. BC1034]